MKGSKPLSVRLNPERWDRLQQHCQQTGDDLSRAVRQALDAYFSVDPAGQVAQGHRLSPPEQVLPLTQRYLAYGDGDVRKELRRLLQTTLACAIACKRLYPRTQWVVETYDRMLRLSPFLDLDG